MILRWTTGSLPGSGVEPAENGRSQAVGVRLVAVKMPSRRHPFERLETNPRGPPSKNPRRSILLSIFTLLLIICVGSSAAPLREVPSNDEPLSVQHGFYPYSTGNSTVSKDESRKVFYQLQGHEMNSHQVGPPIVIKEKQRKKHRKPGRRKPILNGRSQALQRIMSPQGLPYAQHCTGQKFKQRVREKGCVTKTITNRFCHGVCNSFFIPRMHSKKLKAVFKSCAACGPKEYDRFNVTLDCPGQDPPQVTRTVIKVKKCACLNVDLNS